MPWYSEDWLTVAQGRFPTEADYLRPTVRRAHVSPPRVAIVQVKKRLDNSSPREKS